MQPAVTRIFEASTIGDKGQTIKAIRVEFKVGEHGPFSIELPAAGFSAAAANQKISEFVSHLNQIQGVH